MKNYLNLNMFKSATFKLTAYYIALIVAISLIFSVILYQVARGAVVRVLTSQSARIYRHYPIFQNDPILHPKTDIEMAEHRLIWDLAVFNSLVIVIGGFASYALARRTLKPIEEAHEQQKRFTSDVSHELRTPLTAIKMESEVALMNPSINKQELKTVITSSLEEINKLDTLINNLLRLSRLETDELRSEFINVSIKEVINDSLKIVEPKRRIRAIKIINTVQDHTLKGDKTSLIQLLVILLDNAIKYSPDKSTIKISTSYDNHKFNIMIKDEGKGIEKISLEHIFDRFYQVDNSRSKSDEYGYGLGLSIAKTIAEIHAGSITISSRLNHGTTATIILPNTISTAIKRF